SSGERLDDWRSRLDDVAFHQCARVEIGHRRSSMMILESGRPEILIGRSRLSGLRVGSVRIPWAASFASRASRLVARFADLMGMSSAMGLPRSVTTISSPCLVWRRYRVSLFLRSLTPTVLTQSVYLY